MRINSRVLLYILLHFLGVGSVNCQIHVTGIVRDIHNNEVLIGANVFDPQNLTGTTTDNNGYFNLIVPASCDSLLITYIGYRPYYIELNNSDTIVSAYLISGSSIDEVTISASRIFGHNQSGLSKEQLKSMPSIGAEPDVLKSLQTLPGIQSMNEGSSNLVVRGGGPGDNLFLLDNVNLIYVNHLGGFVSVFNPEVLNDVRVIKGGFPAKYGGKLSSIVDITMREGNSSDFRGSAGIGIMGANVTLEGPLFRELTYVLSVRKTLTELLMGAATYFRMEIL